MSEAKCIAGKFRTSVLGIGPYCVEFPDGEIVSTRSEERQDIIANSEQLKADRDSLLEVLRHAVARQGFSNIELVNARSVIAQVKQHTQKGNKR